MKISVFEVESWEREPFKRLGSEHQLQFSSDELTRESAAQSSDADAISIFIYSSIDRELLERLPRLRLIASRSTGVDHIDMRACEERGVTVCNVPSYGKNTVAEHVFGLLLTISHRLEEAIERTRKGDFSPRGLQGFDLRGKTLGVVGTGDIGKEVVRIANGFGMNVLGFDVKPDEEAARALSFRYVDLTTLLRESDVVTLHVPSSPTTHHLLSDEQFAAMKEGVVLINTARGDVVDVQALARALAEGKVSAAGLDVLPAEPIIREEAELLRSVYERRHDLSTLLADEVLVRMRNVVVTPHSAFNTREAVQRILDVTVGNIRSFAAGHPQNQVGGASLVGPGANRSRGGALRGGTGAGPELPAEGGCAMNIVTVSLNPCIDKTFSVERVVADRKLSGHDVREYPGGGGINVARAIGRLGGDAQALWSRGGDVGGRLARLLDAEQIPHAPVSIEGEVRENLIVSDRSTGDQYRFGMPGPLFSDEERSRWIESVRELPASVEYVVFSGSLPDLVPSEWYGELLGAVPPGPRIIVDTKRAALRRALDRGVYLVKPNVRELGEVLGRELAHDTEIEEAARELVADGGTEVVVVSLGRGGAMLVTPDRTERFSAPSVPVRSRVGAGDSMVGAIAVALVQRRSLDEAVRFGVAAGAAAVMREGTELCAREDVERLYPNVRRQEASR